MEKIKFYADGEYQGYTKAIKLYSDDQAISWLRGDTGKRFSVKFLDKSYVGAQSINQFQEDYSDWLRGD